MTYLLTGIKTLRFWIFRRRHFRLHNNGLAHAPLPSLGWKPILPKSTYHTDSTTCGTTVLFFTFSPAPKTVRAMSKLCNIRLKPVVTSLWLHLGLMGRCVVADWKSSDIVLIVCTMSLAMI